jgi:hypothetical protein
VRNIPSDTLQIAFLCLVFVSNQEAVQTFPCGRRKQQRGMIFEKNFEKIFLKNHPSL